MKAALVTGASRGIGRATARLLKEHGYFVFLHGRDKNALGELERELGQERSTLIADLAQPSEVTKLVGELSTRTSRDGQRLHVLVNNAGIFARQMAADNRFDLWETQMRVNLLAPVQLTEALLPQLRAHRPASIVNVASTLGLKAVPGVSAYGATKAAIVHWTQSLALELGTDGIRVNCVCPGLVDTPIHDFHSLPTEQKQAVLAQLATRQPLGRIGTPEEIARSIVFLATEDSAWTTGATLSVDGGINLV